MEEKTYINNVKEIIVKKINKGRNGICYLTKDNQVLKVINDINETKLSELMKYNSESFIFPKSLVYEKKSNKCIGYLMDYVDGMPVKFIPETTLLDKYTHSIKKIEEEIAKLTVYKLHIIDAGISNVLFDVNEDLKVVDTDFYEPKSELKNLYSVNMSSYNYGAIYPIYDLTKQDFAIGDLNKYCKQVIEGKMKPSDFIFELGGQLYYRNIDDYKTIGEFKEAIKVLKK